MTSKKKDGETLPFSHLHSASCLKWDTGDSDPEDTRWRDSRGRRERERERERGRKE
jgi:hypothetical protein